MVSGGSKTSAADIEKAGRVFVDPTAYADEERLERALGLLRRESPIHPVEDENYLPFWALTRHADVMEAERRDDVFQHEGNSIQSEGGGGLRSLIDMDGAEHRAYRGLTVDWFKPTHLRDLQPRLDTLARDAVHRMAESDHCDFVPEFAVQFPLQVILAILGLPESDYPKMRQLTQELTGSQDPEFARGATLEDRISVVQDFLTYFSALTKDRQATPTDDLATQIANGTIHGEPISGMEQNSYYVMIVVAGHDTTAAALAGGIRALAEHPEELARLQADLSLIDTAIDEIVRWVTPVKMFTRRVAEPYELSGHKFDVGDKVLLSYPSANRDEDIFDDPFRFDVGRTPNPHLAFGFGAHYCLGGALAKQELRTFLLALLPRLEHLELAGPPQLTQTTFLGGLKHLPIRYSITDSASVHR